MTYHYNPKAPILGTTLGTYRKVLLAWHKHGYLERMPDRLGLPPATIALLVDDAEARGLFGMFEKGHSLSPTYGPSPAGKTFLSGTNSRRMTPTEAKALLDRLLDNAAAMNADRLNPVAVDRVWLFGSLAQGKPDCGDVDVVIEEAPCPSGDRAHQDYYRKIIRLAYAMGGGYRVERAEFKDWAAKDYVLAKSLYGDRRDPRIKNHPLWDLQSLGCPCKLVFDRAQGGRVDRPLLERHPESEGRSQRQPPRGVVPDMAIPAPPVPCAIELAVEHARMGLGMDPLRGGPTGHAGQTAHSHPTAEELWAAELPGVDGRRHAVIEDDGGPFEYGASRRGIAHLAVALERGLDPETGPVLRLTQAKSLDGKDPGPWQVRRLGTVLAHVCLLDAAKMGHHGLRPTSECTVTLAEASDLPAWAARALEVAAIHVREAGLRVEMPEPVPSGPLP